MELLADFTAVWLAHDPTRYIVRIGTAVAAFGAAISVEKVIVRVIGLVWLLLTGVGLLIGGVSAGAIIDILLGLTAWGAAGYAWWHCRY